MLKLAGNQWVRLGAVSTLTALLGAAIAVTITLSVSSGPSTSGHVSLTSGGFVAPPLPGVNSTTSVVSQELPLTAAEANAAGWKDPVLCSVGRGRYFQKEGVPYLLLYNHQDDLIGIYQFSEIEMPAPWAKSDELKGAGSLIFLEEHWSLIVYFKDPTRACKLSSKGTGTGAYWNYGESAVKSTPTPYLAPTPTPTAGALLQAAAQRMAGIKTLSFTLTSDPVGAPFVSGIDAQRVDGTAGLAGQVTLQATDTAGIVSQVPPEAVPFNFKDLGVTLGNIAGAIQPPADTSGAWIDNVQSRGVSGTVSGQQLVALIPSVVSDAKVNVNIWVDSEGLVRRVRIEGAIYPDDSSEAVRVLDLSDFD